MRLLAIIGAFLFSGIISATPLHNIVVFGDSLSDNGNLYELMNHQIPQSPPYYKGRFSNGRVWIEHLVGFYFPENHHEHLLDYAFGGAGVAEDDEDDVLLTLSKQIKSYFSDHNQKASKNSLYVIWIGANNYLALPTDVGKTVLEVNIGIKHSIQELVEKGAKHILVVNLPDLGRTPAALEFDAVDTMTFMAETHNDLLAQTIANFKREYPDVQWLQYDLSKAFKSVMDQPEDYGFTNIKDTCVQFDEEISKASVLKMTAAAKPRIDEDACKGFVFFDLVHPTAKAHQILAREAILMLDKEGVEFGE
jgi:phospholipase/lecithinase/hemolysin